MKKALYGLFTLMLIFRNCVSYGQQNCNCDIALLSGAQDYFETKTDFKYAAATSELFNHEFTFWSTYEKGWSTSADAAYLMFSASFSTSGSESEQKFELMKENYKKNQTLSQEEQKYLCSKIASPTAYKAWIDCISLCTKSGIYLKQNGSSANEFIISLEWIPHSGTLPNATAIVTNIQSSNCQIVGGDLKGNAIITPWNALLGKIKRNDLNQKTSITVSVSTFGAYTINIESGEIPPIPNSRAPQIISLPIGTITAYAGIDIPNGWLLCDGRTENVYKSQEFNDLYKAIGTYWGSGDGSGGSFNLPDLRGVFLRGVDGKADRDPEHDERLSLNSGGQTGNKVGSYQSDKYATGNVPLSAGTYPPTSGNRTGPMVVDGTWNRDVQTLNGGTGKETRPKNVYVNYIIKY
jgi:Phage Tail Collar Domain